MKNNNNVYAGDNKEVFWGWLRGVLGYPPPYVPPPPPPGGIGFPGKFFDEIDQMVEHSRMMEEQERRAERWHPPML